MAFKIGDKILSPQWNEEKQAFELNEFKVAALICAGPLKWEPSQVMYEGEVRSFFSVAYPDTERMRALLGSWVQMRNDLVQIEKALAEEKAK